MLVGYARVSSLQQDLQRQLNVLNASGCERVYEEKVSGKSVKNRPELERCLSSLKSGDVLVIAEWDRVTRSLYDGIDIIRRVAGIGASIRILDKPHFDLETPMGRGFIAILSALAEDERERIIRRTSMGREVAMRKGVRFGRPNALTELQRARVLEMRASGVTVRAVADEMNVHHSTIARVV